MAKNLGSAGPTYTLTAPADVSSGEVVAVGLITGVALDDAARGQPVVLQTEGAASFRKTANSVAVNAGARVYGTTSSNQVNVTSASRNFLGYALNASPGGSAAEVLVLLARPGA